MVAGKVAISRKNIAKLIGKVFLQRAAVNLLSTVLDTPEYFWSAPDSMQSLYKRVCEYMELDERVEVLNNRFQVLHCSNSGSLPPQPLRSILYIHASFYFQYALGWRAKGSSFYYISAFAESC